MVIVWLILIPLLGGLLSWIVGRRSTAACRWIALLAMTANVLLSVYLWTIYRNVLHAPGQSPWFIDFVQPWIPRFGVAFHLAMDGISLLLTLLASLIGMVAVAASWKGIQDRVGFFHFNLLWILAGINGVFLAFDLLLFYCCWEIMLVPLFLLIDIWGGTHRHAAAVKFFIFTQAGGLFLLVGILGLYFAHGAATGSYTFDYFRLLGTPLSPVMAFWLMLAFFFAFAVKLPVVPVHTWLPDAHAQAPVAGSVDLAGLVLKVGAYGLLRMLVPLFPQAAQAFAPSAMTLALISILYGALLAFSQVDFKRLVAYSNISHMGFILLGVFAWNEWALLGTVIIIIAHSITSGALFVLIGSIDQRLNTHELGHMGGLLTTLPRLGNAGVFLAIATLGLPGLGSFIGEFLILLGTFQVSPLFAGIAAIGLILSTVYSLRWVQQVLFGPTHPDARTGDLSPREMALMAGLATVIVWIGLFPQTVIATVTPSLSYLQRSSGHPAASEPYSPDGTANLATINDRADNGGQR